MRAWARSARMMCARLCVRTRTAAASAEAGVASLCATQSREQVGPGWSRESVLIVFVPLSCLAIVRAASTSWEANCCIYTRRCLPFPSKKTLFIYFYFTMGGLKKNSNYVRSCSCWKWIRRSFKYLWRSVMIAVMIMNFLQQETRLSTKWLLFLCIINNYGCGWVSVNADETIYRRQIIAFLVCSVFGR